MKNLFVQGSGEKLGNAQGYVCGIAAGHYEDDAGEDVDHNGHVDEQGACVDGGRGGDSDNDDDDGGDDENTDIDDYTMIIDPTAANIEPRRRRRQRHL